MDMYKGVVLLAVIASVSSVALWGCPKKAEMSSVPESQQQKVEQAPDGGAAKLAEAQKTAEAERAREAAAAAPGGLTPIHFDFDRSVIRSDARAVLKANAEWLKAHPTVKVRIEGNCDERGTIEYNVALGQRRAQSAKRYLADLGIAAERLALLSYGKERPVCSDSNEECWQKNRRGDFVVAND